MAYSAGKSKSYEKNETNYFYGMAVMAIFVSSCKKEEVEPDNGAHLLTNAVSASGWGYDNTTVEGGGGC